VNLQAAFQSRLWIIRFHGIKEQKEFIKFY
jgi:hypothetical protein